MLTRRKALAIAAGGALAATMPARAQNTAARVRRNINDLPSNHQLVQQYSRAVAALKAKPATDPHNWRRLAEIHQHRCPHQSWFFLPWHRAYLHYFERICAKAIDEPDFALPYWDWNTRLSVPAPFLDRASTLYHARDKDALVSTEAFTDQYIDKILRTGDFETFASPKTAAQRSEVGRLGDLEGGPHNAVHGDLLGDMGGYMSPLDPIFWLHHNNIDRLWDSWLALGNASANDTAFLDYTFRYTGAREIRPAPPAEYRQGDFVDENGGRVAPKVSSVLTSNGLGYQFDALRGLSQSNIARLILPRSTARVLVSQDLSTRNPGGFLKVAEASFSLGQRGAAVSLGRATALNLSSQQIQTALLQKTSPLLEQMANPIVARAVARLTLKEPLPRGVTALVQINCPYISATHRPNDPFFAGVISSFSHDGHDHDASGGDQMGRDFQIEITDALVSVSSLEDGTLENITIQVVSAGEGLNLALDSAQINIV